MSICCMRRPVKFHVDSSVRFWAIVNIREGGGRQTPPPGQARVKPHASRHSEILWRACWITWAPLSMDWWTHQIATSSAKIEWCVCRNKLLMFWAIPSIIIRKRVGEITLPCGMPYFLMVNGGINVLMRTWNVLGCKKFRMKTAMFPRIPFLWIKYKRAEGCTVSYAAARSKNTATVCCFSSNPLCTVSVNLIKLSAEFRPFLNPDWNGSSLLETSRK